MKLRIPVVLGIVALASVASGQPPPKLADLDQPAASPTPTPRPGTKKDSAKKPEEKKDEIGTIEGMTIPRGSGFLGIAVVGGNFRLTFYDAKKKPVAPDVAHAALRWDAHYKLGEERVVLNPSADGKALTSPRVIRPPLTFKLFMTLIPEGAGDGGGETFVIDFHG